MSDYTTAFDEFYRKYPKKVAKTEAFKAWNKAKIEQDVELQQAIMQDLSKRLGSEGWKAKKFIPGPAVYINQARWEDEIIPLREGHGVVSSPALVVEVDATVTDDAILQHMNVTKMKIDEAACYLKVPMRRVEYVVTNHYEEIIANRLKQGLNFTSIFYQLKRDITNYLKDKRRFENERQDNVGQPGSERQQVSGQGGSGEPEEGPEPDGAWL